MPNQNDIKLKSMLRKGTMLHGTYRIDDYLSSGGFGNTYVATHVSFGKRYAIKEFFMDGVNERDNNSPTVKVSNDSKVNEFTGQRAKFYKEAQRLHNLDNRHIVRVHDLFDENGTTYYVMDYIDGENLRERLLRTGCPMSEQEVTFVLRQVLEALGDAHSQGLWHMNLKPSSIMMERMGVVKLIDFGANMQLNEDMYDALMNSEMAYAPPELMMCCYQKIGPWSDFYALGATLYNLLSNRQPPMPSDIDDDCTPDKQYILPKPAGVSNHMWGLVLWLMKTHRSDRPQSVSDITNYLNGKNDDSRGKSGSNLLVIIIALCIGLMLGLVGYSLFDVAKFIKHSNGEMTVAQIDSIRCDSILRVLDKNMVLARGGTFRMGATSEQISSADSLEFPAHEVTLSDFYICKYEVTQELWQTIMGKTISQQRSTSSNSDSGLFGEGPDYPMYYITWDDCQEFISRLNQLTGKRYRMPTEAEWEFAARGGAPSQGYKYAGGPDIGLVAWYSANCNYSTHPVGKKLPNGLGLFDMSGNVNEWCADWCGPYTEDSQTNPTGPMNGVFRVCRGGNFSYGEKDCRVSRRGYLSQSKTDCHIGLRLARDAD